jgi:hypothetical protein
MVSVGETVSVGVAVVHAVSSINVDTVAALKHVLKLKARSTVIRRSLVLGGAPSILA